MAPRVCKPVAYDQNPLFYDLIREFGKLTGCQFS
jgi:predicted NodU family carbamoyl transferase